MGWSIEYDSRVLKDMKKLDTQIQRQVLEYFETRIALSSNPRQWGTSLKSSFSGLWRYRIGDYQAICRIEDDRLVVLVIRIAHRNKVYEKPV